MAVTYITSSGASYTFRNGRVDRRSGKVNPYLAPELQVPSFKGELVKFLSIPQMDAPLRLAIVNGPVFTTTPVREIIRHD